VKIGITIGDPAGIGPEMVLRALPRFRGKKSLFVYGNRVMLKKAAQDLHLRSNYKAIEPVIVDATDNISFEYGRSTKKTARIALQSIHAAMESGAEIIITAPIVKATMRLICRNFIGHTEHFAQFFGVRDYAMVGLWKNKRIMLLTIHVPLRRVFRQIDAGKVARKIVFFDHGLRRYFGIQDPAIGVAAVNPHAFEFSLGEDEKIGQAIRLARRKGVQASGPYPADTLFKRQFDGYIAVYHDQAMVYLKSKKDGLNFTMGLPIARLSPLCGAALDIAGQRRAEISGFVAALKTGKIIQKNMRKYNEEKEAV
jgi:4-hydroxy-L-threonine phosphate dehydrogenase PdxA